MPLFTPSPPAGSRLLFQFRLAIVTFQESVSYRLGLDEASFEYMFAFLLPHEAAMLARSWDHNSVHLCVTRVLCD